LGKGAKIVDVKLSARIMVQAHSHSHQQLGTALRGMKALVGSSSPAELGLLEGYGHIEHSTYSGSDGATLVDVVCPVREDCRG